MKKAEINSLFRAYIREHLSPSQLERDMITVTYAAIRDVLGANNCLQIGSYPRFTSVRPVHDLDVLYILGQWDPSASDPSQALIEAQSRLTLGFKNPTKYTLRIGRQTHSVVLKFFSGSDEVFSVDIVPTYAKGTNSFKDDMYVVPEIAVGSRGERRQIVEDVAAGKRRMDWIRTDPRGYIAAAAQLNQANQDFRRAVKLLKGWRTSCKKMDENFRLKSFHIEQAVTSYFEENPEIDIFDAVFRFFCDLPDLIGRPRFYDRADASKRIDAYVQGLTSAQRQQIIEARDCFLIKLEQIDKGAKIAALLEGGFRRRAGAKEAFLFDQRIPMLVQEELAIEGIALQKAGFRQKVLNTFGMVEPGRNIQFRVVGRSPTADLFKWKVKNDDQCGEPRGEITDHRTRNDPENTKYKGNHYVECYAIRGGVCVAKARQNVALEHASNFI